MRSILWVVVLSFVTLTAVCGASAADITVIQGEALTINADSGVRGEVYQASATFSMPAINYLRDLRVTNVRDPVFTDTVTVDVKPGIYPLTIRIAVEGETVSFEQLTVEVVARKSAAAATVPAKPVIKTSAQSRILEAVSVPAVPDLARGEVFVLPVRVRGNGTYLVEIPNLPFGTYEIPNPVEVNGERIVPVLIHVDPNAQPGTYTIPIYMAGVQTNARIRVIAYTTRPTWTWALMGAGIIILLIAILLALILGNKPREPRAEKREPRTGTNGSDEPMITYY